MCYYVVTLRDRELGRCSGASSIASFSHLHLYYLFRAHTRTRGQTVIQLSIPGYQREPVGQCIGSFGAYSQSSYLVVENDV